MKTHFTRNWAFIVCNSSLGCDGRPVVSDPALLALRGADVCRNCERLLSRAERSTRDAKERELSDIIATNNLCQTGTAKTGGARAPALVCEDKGACTAPESHEADESGKTPGLVLPDLHPENDGSRCSGTETSPKPRVRGEQVSSSAGESGSRDFAGGRETGSFGRTQEELRQTPEPKATGEWWITHSIEVIKS